MSQGGFNGEIRDLLPKTGEIWNVVFTVNRLIVIFAESGNGFLRASEVMLMYREVWDSSL